MHISTRRRLRAVLRDIPAAGTFVLAVGLIYVGTRLLLGWWLP